MSSPFFWQGLFSESKQISENKIDVSMRQGALRVMLMCCRSFMSEVLKMQTVIWEQSSRETLSLEEQVISKGKSTNILTLLMEAIVFIILGYSPVLTGEHLVVWCI